MHPRKALATLMVAAALLTAGPAHAAPSGSPNATASPKATKTAKPLPSSHQAWSEAVTYLEKAKKTLQSDNAKDTNNHKAKALQYIQKAMQELRAGTQGSKH